MVVEQSILKSTKELLDVAPDDDSFDSKILGHINAALSELNDLGAGPALGLFITGDTETWDDLEESPVITERCKSFIYLSVKRDWDPPQTSFLLETHQKQIDNAGWRIVNAKDGDRWIATHPQYVEADVILGGGGPPS